MNKSVGISIIINFLISSISFGQQFYFKKYQVESGLSHNTVNTIIQDSYGFIWLGTDDGLNRLEGSSIKIFRKELRNNHSLGNNFVHTLLEDQHRDIWVGTSSGLYLYDRQTESFKKFIQTTEYGVVISCEVSKIIQTPSGKIWIATLGQGIFIYDPINKILLQKNQTIAFVWDLCQNSQEEIFAASKEVRLVSISSNGEIFTPILKTKKNNENSKITYLQCIEDKIYFGDHANTLSEFDSHTRTIRLHEFTAIIGSIRSIIKYDLKNYLFSSESGLFLYNLLNEKITRVDNPKNPRSLSNQSTGVLFKDKEGGIWISTYLGGVSYLAPQTKIFNAYYPVDESKNGTGKVINQFCQQGDTIWIGTQKGLRLLNRKNGLVFLHKEINRADIRALLLIGKQLWIGTNSNGLFILNTKTNQFKNYQKQAGTLNSICSDEINTLFKDGRGDIYIGTRWGLCKYDPINDQFITINYIGAMNSVVSICEDKDQFLWFGTSESGLFRYNPSNKQWFHFFYDDGKEGSIISNSITTLFKDSKGDIWIGTNGDGICRYNYQTKKFDNLDPQENILPNRVIHSIEEDKNGDFWISSNAGLLRISPSNPSQPKLFTKEDGLQSNQFNFRSSLKAKLKAGQEEEMFFGGINGFNSFQPTQFKTNEKIPPVYITDVKLYRADGSNKYNELQTQKPFYLQEKITLPFKNNSLVIKFASLSFAMPSKNQFMYMLKGFDKNWIYNNNSNQASYTNLPSGEYTFYVQGSNNDEKWNIQGASMHITILPPWWRSSYMKMLYIVLLLVILLSLLYFYNKFVQNKYRQKLHQYQTEKEKKDFQTKISFFINLVHEIRTPLSLIKLPLEKLSDIIYEDSKTTKYLTIINKNVNYLLHVVTQLLDFQKVENQQLQLVFEENNIHLLVQELYIQFAYMAELKNITLELILPEQNLNANVDKKAINTILVNVISNALKFAKSKIRIELSFDSDQFHIEVMDDGKGILDKDKERIFEAYHQLENNKYPQPGTGIGLHFSKLLSENHHGKLIALDNEWEGASFKLSIPLNEKNNTTIKQDIDNYTHNIPSSSSMDYSSNKVLLVEDNEELLTLLEESLCEYFTIYTAHNGKQGVDILETESIDIVVSDIMMPIMDGLELCSYIKTNINYSHIPVILLTAKTTLDAKTQGLDYGAEVYLDKPFSIWQVKKQIENLINLRKTLKNRVSLFPSVDLSASTISDRDAEFLEKLKLEINQRMHDVDFKIDQMAEVMNMSRSNFYRKIKSLVDLSPSDFLKTLRLNKSKELLKEGSLTVAEIAENVGFSSSSYFAKCFKDSFGVSPKSWTHNLS